MHSDRETVSSLIVGARVIGKTPVCKWLKYRVFYATVGFRTAAAANPSWGSSPAVRIFNLPGTTVRISQK